MKSKRNFLILGQLSFAAAMVIKHFFPEGDIFSFMAGMFTGLTIAGHTAFLLSVSAKNIHRIRILF